MWALGPGRLDFTRLSLVALYQMAGRYFMAEFSAELPRDPWHRPHRSPSPKPRDVRYYQDSPVFYGDPPYRRK